MKERERERNMKWIETRESVVVYIWRLHNEICNWNGLVGLINQVCSIQYYQWLENENKEEKVLLLFLYF